MNNRSCGYQHFLSPFIKFVLLGILATASAWVQAIPVFTNPTITPISGTVAPGGKLVVTFDGTVRGGSLYESVYYLQVMKGTTELAFKEFTPLEGPNGAPVNETRKLYELPAVELPEGRHELHILATSTAGKKESDKVTIIVTESAPANGSKLVGNNVALPSTVEAGRTYPYEVVMQNTGTETWVMAGAFPYSLGSQNPQDNYNWGKARLRIPNNVAPGAQVVIRSDLTAPLTAGFHDFEWKMVKDNAPNGWFGETVKATQKIEVVRTKPTLSFSAPSTTSCTPSSGNSCTVTFVGNGTAVSDFSMKVLELYVDGSQVATGTNSVTASYTLTGIGNHTIELRGKDSRDVDARTSMTFTVRPPAPVALLTGPADYSTFQIVSGNTYPIVLTGTSSASSPATLTSVVVRSVFSGTSYSVPGGNLSFPMNLAPGSHMIQMTATDSYGNTSYSNSLHFTVQAPSPSVSMSAPTGPVAKVTATGSAVVRFIGSANTPAGTMKRIDLVDSSEKVWGTVNIGGGASGTFDQDVSLPIGDYTLRFKAFNSYDASAYSGSVSVSVISGVNGNGAKFVSQSVPSSLRPGEPYNATVTMMNNGTTTWSEGQRYRLGAQKTQDNRTWISTARAYLTSSVAPGQSYTFTLPITAPQKVGAYDFQWQMVQDDVGWFGATTDLKLVTVTSGTGPTATLNVSPTNSRVGAQGYSTLTFSGSGERSGGVVSKLELLEDSGAGFGAAVASSTGGSSSLALSTNLNRTAGIYKYKLRATDSSGLKTDSEIVTVNVVNSPLLGTIKGVRSNAAGAPELYGWVCEPGKPAGLSYQVLLDTPSQATGGTVLTTGVANVGTEPDNAAVQTSCSTVGSPHHFVVNLSSYLAQYSGRSLYVVASNAAGANPVALPCADNSCTMPGTQRVTLATPLNNDKVAYPNPVFMRMQLTGFSGALDEVGFVVAGEFVSAQPDGGGYYAASKSGLNASATKYPVYARVRQGKATILSLENQFEVVSGDTISLTSPANNAALDTGTSYTLQATVAGYQVPSSVRFFANGTVVATGTGGGATWSGSWTPTQTGAATLIARSYDGAGTQLAESAPVSVLINAGSAPEEPPINVSMPFLSDTDAGTLPGELSVSPGGNATYSMALTVPPGTAGMAPQLSLNYSSDRGNGILGLGWSLGGLSHIHRCGKTVAQDGVNAGIRFNVEDRLCLDGQRLVLVNTALTDAAYWADGAEYRTEIESFSRVTLFNKASGISFKVESKDGRISYYGGGTATVKSVVTQVASGSDAVQPNADSKKDGQSWAIARVEDRSGNYVSYQYEQNLNTGEHIPKYIRYGGAGQSAHAAVEFVFESRTDSWKRYIDETRNDLRQRIVTIRTHVGDNLDASIPAAGSRAVHRYEFGYDMSPTSGRSMLQTVQPCATAIDGSEKCLLETTFRWGKPSKVPGFVSRGKWAGAPIMTTHKADANGIVTGKHHPEYFSFGDFDRDGYADVLELRVSSMTKSAQDYNPLPPGTMQAQYRYFRNTGSGFNVIPYRLSTGENFVVLSTGDFDGDGALDLIVQGATNGTQICLSPLGKPNSVSSEIVFACKADRPAVGGNSAFTAPYVTDVLGEGRAAHFGRVGNVLKRCSQNSCADVTTPPSVLNIPLADDGSPEYTYHSYQSFSQMVDFSGVGKSYDVRWTRMNATRFLYDGPDIVEQKNPFWQNTRPTISILGAGFDDNPVANYVYPDDFRNASLVPLQIAYQFDQPTQGGVLTADFNGSGYNSLAFGYLEFDYPNGVRSYKKADMTICLSTGRALDCNVRKKYSGRDYRAVRTIGSFVGDGAPAILAEKISYPVGARPAPTGELEVCRVKGDDAGISVSDTDSNIVCKAWPGLKLPTGPFTNGPGNAVYFMDLLGTGRPQVVIYHSGYIANNTWREVGEWEVFEPIDVAADGVALDRLIQVSNGMGASSAVEYADALPNGLVAPLSNSSLSYPIQASRAPGKLVRRLKVGNGVSPTRTIRYAYADPATDASGRGALGFGKVTATDEQTGIVTTTRYSQMWPRTGQVEAVTVQSGEVILSTTVNDVRAMDIAHTAGAKTKFVYVDNSSVTRRDANNAPLGSVYTKNDYTTDGWANLVKQVITSTDSQNTFTTTIDKLYKPTNATNWLLGLVDTVYTTNTKAGSSLNPKRTVKHNYDDKGRLSSDIIEPGNEKYQVTTTYDRSNNAFGLVGVLTQSWKDPVSSQALARTTTTEYDPKGRFPKKVTRLAAAGNEHVESRTHDDGSGAATSHTAANGFKTTWTVDGFGQVQKEYRDDGNETRTYLKFCSSGCPAGAMVARVTESYRGTTRIGVPSVVFSDAVGHVLRTQTWGIDGSVIVTDQTYDGFGRPEKTYHPRYENLPSNEQPQVATRSEYDILNRVTKQFSYDEGGREVVTSTTYDGFNITRTNPRKHSRVETRNVLGQLVNVKDANGKNIKYEYDLFGNLSKTTDPNGNEISVGWNLWGHKESLIDPDLGTVNYTVDPLGRVREQYTARQGTGKKTVIEYDFLNRMTARIEPAISASEPGLEGHWIYDTASNGKGQLAEAYTGTAGAKDYSRLHTYDQWGRPKQVSQKINNVLYLSEQDYDVYGRLELLTHTPGTAAAKQYKLRYGNAGHLRQIMRGTKALWTLKKNDASLRPTEILLGNGLSQLRDFNKFSGRLNGASVQLGTSARMTEGYAYDEIGSVKRRDLFWSGTCDVPSCGFSETFDYDPLNRLEFSTVSVGGLQEKQQYKYDDAGNITEKNGAAYVYPTQGAGAIRPHAVQSVAGLGSYGYDANGNVRSTPTGNLTWTAFDMPERINKGSVWAEFKYGPEHQRVLQRRSDGTTVVYAGAQEIEIKATGTTVKTYWPSGIGVEIDRPNAATSEFNWSHKDWLGSPVALSDEAGALRESMAYDPWGKRRKLDGSAAPDTLDGRVDNRGFTGHEMLDQLDLVHMNGRIYDPRLGKFLSADPLISDPLDGQNYNRYSYVLNNPTNMTDPTGFCQKDGGAEEGCDTKYEVTGSNLKQKKDAFNMIFNWIRPPEEGKKADNGQPETNTKNNAPAGGGTTSGGSTTGGNGENSANTEKSFWERVKESPGQFYRLWGLFDSFVPNRSSFEGGVGSSFFGPCFQNCDGHNALVQSTSDVMQGAGQGVAEAANQYYTQVGANMALGALPGGGGIVTRLFKNLAPADEIIPAVLFPASQIQKVAYSGRLTYVVMPNGELVIGRTGHISLSRGADVLAAGEVRFVNGGVRSIDNASGHYRPSGDSAKRAAEAAFSRNGFEALGKYAERKF